MNALPSATRGRPRFGVAPASILLLSLIVLLVPLAGRSAGLPAWLRADLQKAGIPLDAVAVYAKEAATGEVLVDHNADAAFKPASIMKVLTTYAALEILGEDYVWNTPVYATGTVRGGELQGDLIFRGVGDPSLSFQRMREFCAQLYRRGIRVIKGDVIIDKSFFGFSAEVPEQFYREFENPWNLPPQPLLVNGKLVTLTVLADRRAGVANASVEPDLAPVKLDNRVTLAPGPCGGAQVGLDVEGDAKAAVIRVSGVFPDQCGAYVKRVSVLGADAYFGAAFKRGYEGLGGRVDGSIRPGQAAAQAKFVGAIPSDPLMEILRETNKNSNNLMARQLLLTLGAVLTGKPPSPSDSVAAIRAWITPKVPDTAAFVVENGSGLSDRERVTAKGMVSLLDYIRTSRFAAQFLDTLPAVGEDGTMRQRLREQPVAGRSVAKTGTLRDTRAIAGIVVSKHGRSYIFCMIVNHPRASAAVGTIDALIAWLHSVQPAAARRSAASRP